MLPPRIGNRRGRVPGLRSEIAERLVKELGMSLADVARLLRVSTSAISRVLHRIAQERSE
jgi:predicted transcriptional regulator